MSLEDFKEAYRVLVARQAHLTKALAQTADANQQFQYQQQIDDCEKQRERLRKTLAELEWDPFLQLPEDAPPDSRATASKPSAPTIFLAHASEDKPQVRQLYQRLKDAGCQPWLDEVNLLPGQNWRSEIPRSIKASDAFVMCFSQQSVSKHGYVQKELKMALNRLAEKPPGEIYLIPLKLEPCEIPDLRLDEYGLVLRDLHFSNYWQPGEFEKLLRAIGCQ